MLKFSHAALLRVLVLLSAIIALLPSAAGQSFTMQASPFHPFSVDPGEPAWSTLTLNPVNGFTGSVALSCSVTPQLTSPPTCTVSPSTVVPPVAGPTVTVTSTQTTTPTTYTITVTGTGTGTNPPTNQAVLSLSVLGVTADYTLTVTTPVTPTSVHAGYSATGIVTITPLNGYTGEITLSCSQVTPAVTIPPICTFTPTPLPITGAATTANLTILTIGPTPTAMRFQRIFYALGFPLFGVVAIGSSMGRGGKRSRKWLALASLCLIALLALVPACGSSSSTSPNPNGNTPNNSYTFTLTGADANGVVPSNISTPQTVTLTVD